MKNIVIHHKFEYWKSKDEALLDICKGKNVLHIGATDSPFTEIKHKAGSLLHDRLKTVAKSLIGFDVDELGLKLLKRYGYKVIKGDLNKKTKLRYKADVILFGETIEHITNFDTAFDFFKQNLTKNGLLVVSTPNSYCGMYFVINLFGVEIIHPDHKSVFSMATLTKLLKTEGFDVKRKIFTNLSKYRGEDRFIFKFFRFVSRLLPQTSETLLVVAKKSDENG